MSEPLTARKQRILEVLSDSFDPITAREVNLRAFKVQTRLAVTEKELFDLCWRGLASKEDSEVVPVFAITVDGQAAL